MKFSKYHGLGNDFIMIDNRECNVPLLSVDQCIRLCHRNFGIGADGVIFALPGVNDCDYTMRVVNSDGSIAQMCGNGLRCLAVFLRKLENNQTECTFRISTGAGIIIASIIENGDVVVDMGVPKLSPGDIPSILTSVVSSINVQGQALEITAVGMGNPHGVVFVAALDSLNPPFVLIGPAVSTHESFPEGCNAEFVEVVTSSLVRVKVWERGAGPTLACGTGACAVVVAGVLRGLCDRQCTVDLPGGSLSIEWRESNNRVYMTGPGVEVFCGIISAELLR